MGPGTEAERKATPMDKAPNSTTGTQAHIKIFNPVKIRILTIVTAVVISVIQVQFKYESNM